MKKISLLLSLLILVSCSKEMNQELSSEERRASLDKITKQRSEARKELLK